MFSNFINDTRGNVIMIFGLCMIPMFAVAGFAIDYQQTVKRKAKVQLVLDSSVLAGARIKQTSVSDEVVKQTVQDYLSAQMVGLGGLTCDAANVTVYEDSEEIDADITCRQTTYIMNVIGRDQIPFKVSSGSDYGIEKLDVAFMFDISGSMNSSSRLTNLKSAAQDAVNILLPEGASQEVLDNTRLAMVSYNAMVNAGDFFEDVAGVTPTRTYSEEVTKVTTPESVSDEGDLYDDIFLGLYNSQSDDLIIEFGDDAVLYVEEDLLDTLNIGVTVPSGSDIYRDDESAELKLSGDDSHTQNENGSPYALFGDSGGNYYNGTLEYGEYELRIRLYERDNRKGDRIFNKTVDFEIAEPEAEVLTTETETYTLTSTCVWERDGTDAFTDASPESGGYLAHQQAWFVADLDDEDGGEWKVGHPNRVDHRRYDGDECRSAEPVELTNNRDTLNTYVTSLSAGGYTAGHLGIAWTWYLISEEWDHIFDGTAAPLAYSEPDSAKVVILMTDGAFNTEVFPEQGDSAEQAEDLCDNMKEADIKVYAVALNAPTAGQDVLSYCASGSDYYFEPETAEQLTDAYKSIATSISDLRISK
ncbi:MAG: TadE/TadG family type IV pilus assembly protein [Pseudomonadota bacterium]